MTDRQQMSITKDIFGVSIVTFIAWFCWEIGGSVLAALYSKIGSQGFRDVAGFFGFIYVGCLLYFGLLIARSNVDD